MTWPLAGEAIEEDLAQLRAIAASRRDEIECFRTSGKYEPIPLNPTWEGAVREGIVW